MFDALTDSVIIIFTPILLTLIAVYVTWRKKHSSKTTKKNMFLALGFISLACFFAIVPDPEFVQAIFLEKGNYATPLFYSIVAAIILYITIIVFKKHQEG